MKDIVINTYPPHFNPKFSMVMPVHNESDSITRVVMEVHEKLCKKIPFEIILSEDGSKDNTKEVIIELTEKIPLKAILSHTRKGYSGGIKEGLKHVSSPYVIASDSDGQHRPSDFWKLKEKLEELDYRKDVIISGKRITRSDTSFRKIMSKTFQKLAALMFDLPPMKDITGPFKLMNIDLARNLADECKYMKESFWTEFTIRACNKKIKIVEVPVQHINRLEGETVVYKKSKIPKIVMNQLKALIKIKKELTGKDFVRSILETNTIRQLLTFGLVGLSGAGIILFLTWLGVNFGLHYILSAAIGIETSIFWAFYFNHKITFRKSFNELKLSHRFLKYHGSVLGGLGINLLTLYLLTSGGVFYLLSEAIAIAIAFGFNFTVSKKIVWKT